MQRAKRLLEGLRIHHLGFGFFWTVTFIVLAGFQGAGAVADYWQIYILTEQTLMPLAVGALGALCAFRRCELPHWTASAASFMLSGAALLYFLAFHFGQGDGVIAAAAGILMGGSCALFFLLWEMFYVTEGQQRALICIPLSAAMSVGLYLLICLLPSIAVALTAVCVLPFLALLCLQKSLAEIEADVTAPLTRPALRRAVGELWRPVLCVSILGFSWKLIAGIEPAQSSGGAAVLVGFAAAALLVVALELFLSKGFDILHICQVLFPALTVVFLLPSLFGQQYTTLLVAFLMFGFEVVNLLLIITCAVYTIRNGLPSSPLYALCIGPVLLSMAVGSGLAELLGPALSDDLAHWTNVILLCVVLLSVALILVTRGKGQALASMTDAELLNRGASLRRGRRDGRRDASSTENGTARTESEPRSLDAAANAEAGPAPSDGPSEQQRRIHSYLEERGLSPREIEVAELLMKGHTVLAIAGKLFISENTTRGHAKSIYKKLDIHSRQELVDLDDQLTRA